MMLKMKQVVGCSAMLKLTALAQVAFLLFVGSAASAQEGNRLQDIQVQSLPGQRVELKLIMTGTAPQPLAFTIEDPARIALDLPDTTLGLTSRRRDVNLGPLNTILTAEANGRTRVVLNLGSMVAYETRASGNTVTITLGDGEEYSAGTTQFASNVASPQSYAGSGSARAITSVDFRRTRDGGGRVVVNLTDSSTPVDIRQEGGRVVAVFKDTDLPAELMRRLDVMDFATPVTTVDTLRTNLDTRIVISAEGKYEQLAYQSDNEFTIEVNPVTAETEEGSNLFSETKEYEGQRLTLNFQDIETRAVLQLLAETSGRNIVVSDTVQGNVTLRLRNVPWDQALDIVMTTKGLDMRQNGNVIIVAPAEEIAARETADLEAKQAIAELEPLYSEFLQVNYAKASSLADLIAGGGGNALLSDRGSIAVDDRTNTLLVQDTADRLINIRRMVATLDIPIRQVLIESRIVVVNDDFSRDLGVRLGVTAFNENSSDGVTVISGSGSGTDTMVGSVLDNLADPGNGTIYPIELPTLSNRYNVNVPIADAAGRFALAVLESDYLVDLELTALEAEGRGEIVSTPRVITANQKEARIEQGVEIPYQQSASSGATTIQFKKAVLSLTVTPQITPDNNIIMDLTVHKDSVGECISTGGLGGTVPSIDTRAVETQVLVSDGQTVVLGGIYETERRETINKVPFLGDIPFLGRLFKSKTRIDNKAELLIFVTPRILEEGSNIY
ncbi:MAG: type IV pilus secretin PilQ [Gammaproteobacteria bacterium]|nr:type IV pilus secretin PilQ [Gammaproteobacteria bacterium]